MKNNRATLMRKKMGFTLTEIMVATALASLVAAAGYAAFSYATRYVLAGGYQVQFNASGRIAAQKITQYIENGKAISVGTSSNGFPELDIMTVSMSNSAIRFVTGDGGIANVQSNMLVFVPDTAGTNTITICTYAGPIPGEPNPMFSIINGNAALVCFHVGDGTNVNDASFSGTGPGYQGVDIRLSATPRNIQRWYQ